MFTLTLCLGILWGGCIQLRTYDFPDAASCNTERKEQIPHLRGGWAVCAPKQPTTRPLV